MMLSKKAIQQLQGNAPPLVHAHCKCQEDPFHPQTNPLGYVNLGIAENHLLWEALSPILNAERKLDETAIHYDLLYGSLSLRRSIADYLTAYFANDPIDPDSIVVASGTSSIIDILIQSLCEPGDGILVPAPYYSGFDVCLKLRCDAQPIAVPLKADQGFSLSVGDLEKSLLESRAQGVQVKAVLVTNPGNPTGHSCSAELTREIALFARKHGLHCIFDEIYANSMIGQSEYWSALSLPPEMDHVHVVSGFAKDFALSGFKVGYLHSHHRDLIAALRQFCYLCPASTYTQRMLTDLLSDPARLEKIIAYNRKQLVKAYSLISAGLRALNIPFLEPSGGQFLLLNLRSKLKNDTFEDERALWSTIFLGHKLSITPGEFFHCAEPGWFRLCYANSEEALLESLQRLRSVMAS